MAETERESDRGRREEKWQTCWCCRDQQRACRIAQASAEKLEQTRLAENERVASVPHRESSWQERQSRPCQKEKSRLSRAPDHGGGGGEVKVGKSPTLARERRIRARARRGKGGLHSERRQIPRRKGRASKKTLPKRSTKKHERVSGRKSFPERSAKSWFHSMSGQI